MRHRNKTVHTMRLRGRQVGCDGLVFPDTVDLEVRLCLLSCRVPLANLDKFSGAIKRLFVAYPVFPSYFVVCKHLFSF